MSENRPFTQNDLSELMDILQKAIKTTPTSIPTQGMHGFSSESMDILDNLMGRVPSLDNTVFGPVITNIVRSGAASIISKSKELGDRYGIQVDEDIENNRYNRISILLRMSLINQMRLRYGSEQYFSEIRDYVVKTYHEDVADPEGTYGFVPQKSEQSVAIWDIIDSLVSKGLITVLEDVELSSGNSATIIKMERTVS